MSRSIASSITALRNALSKCITSITKKEVSVPTTAKVSDLSYYIDKIQTEPPYSVTINFQRFNSPNENIYIDIRKRSNPNNSGSWDSRHHYKGVIPKDENEITFSDLVPGVYDIYYWSLNNTGGDAYGGCVSVGAESSFLIQGPTIIFAFSDPSQVKAVHLGSSDIPDEPHYTIEKDGPPNSVNVAAIGGFLKGYHSPYWGTDQLRIQKQDGKWYSSKPTNTGIGITDMAAKVKGKRYPCNILIEVDVENLKHTTRYFYSEGAFEAGLEWDFYKGN